MCIHLALNQVTLLSRVRFQIIECRHLPVITHMNFESLVTDESVREVLDRSHALLVQPRGTVPHRHDPLALSVDRFTE